MTDARASQRADIARKIEEHRQWLVTATEYPASLTSSQYGKWRAELTALMNFDDQVR
jgi:hypothetical protein